MKSSRRDDIIQSEFPTSVKEMKELGWEQADIILFTGDAFIDHPAFGIAVIARVLEKEGYNVAVVPQPNWRDDLRDFKKLGSPRLFFGVTSGNMDSMVNHYTANKRLRSTDAFTPGNKSGQRPDYATTVYSNILKSLYPNIPLVIGGIEASLRRLTHYDYWSDTLMPSVLAQSNADLLVYGMGEKGIIEIAKRLNASEKIESLVNIPQTAYRAKGIPPVDHKNRVVLASFEECLKSKKTFAKNFTIIEEESNKIQQRVLVESNGESWIVVNPPYLPLSQDELDTFYDLPYTRMPHPRYTEKEKIPAYEMIKDSVTIHRGCFGGCSFCTISAHQGKFISSRSKASIIKELKTISQSKSFKGHITDLGGPSANMYNMTGINQKQCASCKRPSCIYPGICKNLEIDSMPLIDLYRTARQVHGIKKVTIGSGIRYDLLIDEDNQPTSSSALPYLEELIKNHVSGRLKVAPEHTSERVLKLLRKPAFKLFIHLQDRFRKICTKYGLDQQLIPYFISGLPESGLEEMAELACNARTLNLNLEQVQEFTPTPMTLASVMFYTGLDPYTLTKVKISRSIKDKKLQHLLFFMSDKIKRRELKRELEKLKSHNTLKLLKL